MATRPLVHSQQVRSDSLVLPPGTTIERRGVPRQAATWYVAMFQGMSSQGYQTNYQRVPTFWVEAECRGPGTDTRHGALVKRDCWRFSGKSGEDRARAAYAAVLNDLAENYPNAEATFPTGPGPAPCHVCRRFTTRTERDGDRPECATCVPLAVDFA